MFFKGPVLDGFKKFLVGMAKLDEAYVICEARTRETLPSCSCHFADKDFESFRVACGNLYDVKREWDRVDVNHKTKRSTWYLFSVLKDDFIRLKKYVTEVRCAEEQRESGVPSLFKDQDYMDLEYFEQADELLNGLIDICELKDDEIVKFEAGDLQYMVENEKSFDALNSFITRLVYFRDRLNTFRSYMLQGCDMSKRQYGLLDFVKDGQVVAKTDLANELVYFVDHVYSLKVDYCTDETYEVNDYDFFAGALELIEPVYQDVIVELYDNDDYHQIGANMNDTMKDCYTDGPLVFGFVEKCDIDRMAERSVKLQAKQAAEKVEAEQVDGERGGKRRKLIN